MIKLSSIGTSKIAESFVSAALKTGRFRLHSVYSRSYETGAEFARKFGCEKIVTDLKALADDPQCEAVYIASPNKFHYEQSKLLLSAAKHVICEKTVTENVKQFEELCQIARQNNVIFMDAIIPVYAESRPHLLKALGSIGKITSARLDFSRQSTRYDDFLKGEQVNIFDMSLRAGALMDLGVYCVYAALDLFGMPKKISAAATFLSNGADGGGTAIFYYDNFNAVITYDKTATSVIGSEIIGDKGTVSIGALGVYQKLKLHKAEKESEVFGFIPKIDIMMGEANAFADFIGGTNIDKYTKNSQLTKNVLTCMDEIKGLAGINYEVK